MDFPKIGAADPRSEALRMAINSADSGATTESIVARAGAFLKFLKEDGQK
jgi:hypothetical protein